MNFVAAAKAIVLFFDAAHHRLRARFGVRPDIRAAVRVGVRLVVRLSVHLGVRLGIRLGVRLGLRLGVRLRVFGEGVVCGTCVVRSCSHALVLVARWSSYARLTIAGRMDRMPRGPDT